MITLVLTDRTVQLDNDKFQAQAINNLIQQANQQDLTWTVPISYQTMIAGQRAIDNYLGFLQGPAQPPTQPPTQPPAQANNINNAELLAACLTMNTFLDDSGYFNHLLAQLLQGWSVNQTVLSLITNLGLLREIALYLPFWSVPDHFKVKPTFVKEWLTIADNKNVLLNSSELVTTQVFDGQLIVSNNYGTYRGYRIDYYLTADYRLLEQTPSLSIFGRHGQQRRWSTRGQLRSVTHYIRNQLSGEELTYHDNGQLDSRTNFKDGYMCGDYERYLEDGRLAERGSYQDSDKSGRWYKFDPVTAHHIICHYHDDKLHGPYQVTTHPATITTITTGGIEIEVGQYSNNQKSGIWRLVDIDNKTQTVGCYQDGVKSDRWNIYCLTSNRLLKQQTFYRGQLIKQVTISS